MDGLCVDSAGCPRGSFWHRLIEKCYVVNDRTLTRGFEIFALISLLSFLLFIACRLVINSTELINNMVINIVSLLLIFGCSLRKKWHARVLAVSQSDEEPLCADMVVPKAEVHQGQAREPLVRVVDR